MKQSGSTQFILASLLSAAIMLLTVSIIKLNQIFPLINSDSVFFQVLYQDLLLDGNTLKGWDLNTTFNLFPNALLYLLAFLISNNPFINTLIHGLLQYSLFFAALYVFYKSFKPAIPLSWHVPGLLLINLIFFDAIITGDYYIATLFIHPYHFGSFIVFYLLIAVNFHYNQSGSKWAAIIVLILAVFGIFSNRILMLMFTIPWILVMLIAVLKSWLDRNTATRSILLNLFAAVLGNLLFVLVKNLGVFTFAPTKLFSWENVLPSFNALFNTYSELFQRSIPMAVMLTITLGFFILNLLWCLRDFFTRSKAETQFFKNSALSIWMLISLLFTLIIFFAPAINGMFFSLASIRYNYFVLILPLTSSGIVAYKLFMHRTAANTIARIFAVITLVAFLLITSIITFTYEPLSAFKDKKNLYPARAQAMDELSEQMELKGGIALYWDAKTTTIYSKNNIAVRQVYPDLSLYPLAVARSWYYPQKEGHQQPVFNFIMYHPNMDRENMEEIFGEEIKAKDINGFQFLIVPEFTYNRNRRIELLNN